MEAVLAQKLCFSWKLNSWALTTQCLSSHICVLTDQHEIAWNSFVVVGTSVWKPVDVTRTVSYILTWLMPVLWLVSVVSLVWFSGFVQAALRQITDKAREFGAGPLFNQILPLLMSPTLEDQERHLLVKVIDRILYKLDDLVRPYVHKVCCSSLFHLWFALSAFYVRIRRGWYF